VIIKKANLMSVRMLVALCTFSFLFVQIAIGQKSKKEDKPAVAEPEKTILEKTSLAGLKFRSIGPAIASGRIADLAVHPENSKIYYAAVASGGVWKTVNAGTI
jgi:hypothetical protein